MKVVLTRRALADLDEIRAYIAQEDAGRANAFVRPLHQQCASLSRHARRYPAVATIAERDVRKFSYRRYLIFYAASENEVQILRIIHGAREWGQLFS